MPRKRRDLQPGYCYHITVRCNNREFRLTRLECREVLLFAIKQCQQQYKFKLYGLCIMSNHVHYLIEPKETNQLPKIMHLINWYTAMSFNQMLNRTGHFWEKRYHSTGFPVSDKRRALNTLRYIHANPKAAGIQSGFFNDFSNYGTYDRLTNDGLTIWHPAFLALAPTLEACAAAYRRFCQKYRPQPKPEVRKHWGSQRLAGLKPKPQTQRHSPGQQRLPWASWEAPAAEIVEVARRFVLANALNPLIAARQFVDPIEPDELGDNAEGEPPDEPD
ncbi:REP-associated tyrosine transposase [Trichothermofontia sp.]